MKTKVHGLMCTDVLMLVLHVEGGSLGSNDRLELAVCIVVMNLGADHGVSVTDEERHECNKHGSDGDVEHSFLLKMGWTSLIIGHVFFANWQKI